MIRIHWRGGLTPHSSGVVLFYANAGETADSRDSCKTRLVLQEVFRPTAYKTAFFSGCSFKTEVLKEPLPLNEFPAGRQVFRGKA